MCSATRRRSGWLSVVAAVCTMLANVSANAQSARVLYVPGSSQRICQVSGERDQALPHGLFEVSPYAPNRTETNYMLRGNDLGASFEHKGELYIFFGDTIPVGSVRENNLDSVAHTNDTNPDDCISLNFLASGGVYTPPQITSYPAGVTPIGHTEFRVPVHGFSVPGACPGGDAKMYVFFADLLDAGGNLPDGPPPLPGHPGRRAVLSSSCSDYTQFTYTYEVSTDKFINIYAVPVNGADVPNQPEAGPGLLVFGAGQYRASPPFLAFVPFSHLEDQTADHHPTGWKYFTGLDASGNPKWGDVEPKDDEPKASLFQDAVNFNNAGPCIGEFSVHYNQYLQKWVMLYNCHNAIRFQYADHAWGPWSDIKFDAPDRSVVFDPDQKFDNAYTHFMHLAFPHDPETACTTDATCPDQPDTLKACAALFMTPQICRHWVPDRLNDRIFEDLGYDRRYEGGGVYGPYIINRYIRGDSRSSTIYYLMSTWNPYQPMLMKSQLRLERPPVARAGSDQTLPADNNCGASAQLDGSASSDPDGDTLTFTWKDAAGNTVGTQATITLTLSLGAHTFTLTVDDGLGGTASDTVTITVVDTTPPTLTTALGTTILQPPDHALVNTGFTAAAVDNCDGALPVTVSVAGNEDDETNAGDGVFSPDAADMATVTLRLRRERIGGGQGRVYLIRSSAQDNAGNRTFACDAVVVPRDSTPASLNRVQSAASSAVSYCQSHAGAAPPQYFVIGDGAVIGPKQ